MKTKLYLLAINFFISIFVFGQKYGNVWHFGNQAGIDFKNCQPEAITTSAINGFEECASICDPTGQLLFYTNSDVVWNKLNQVMANGNLISTGGTLSQVLIIPKPGSSSLFYIITTMIQASGSLRMEYHEVDMQQNLGLGAVVSANNILTTWVTTEQVAATYHSNGTDIWIMTHEYGTDKFLAYLVTSSGISSTPVISTVGPSHVACTSSINARGEIKFSPDGRKVVFNGNGVGNNSSTNILSLFDFDNSSGVVSNAINLPYSKGEFGLSFSSDNSKLYGSTWKAFAFGVGEYNYIYQFDLSSGIPDTIIASKIIVDSVSSTTATFGSMKLAPDGKIYIARANSTYLGVINDPNLAGLACNYVSNGFYLDGKTSSYGLNNYIEYQTYCSSTTDINSIENQMQLSIYPNPFSNQTEIDFNGDLKETELIVYNSLGKVVYKQSNFSGNKIVFDRSELASGIYFVSLIEKNLEVARKKFIVLDK